MDDLVRPMSMILTLNACCLAFVTGCGAREVNQSSVGTVARQSRTSSARAMRAAYITSTQRVAQNVYAAKEMGEFMHLENSAQRFVASIHSAGVELSSDKDQILQLQAVGLGCAGSKAAITYGKLEAYGNRVDVRRRELDESYFNGPLGLEQVFVVSTRKSQIVIPTISFNFGDCSPISN